MINKENIDKEFWKAIGTHYEKECYEDTLKDVPRRPWPITERL